MIYIISRQMYENFSGSKAAIIEYINETYCLRDEVVGIIIR